jgi:hypothetical protein
MNLLRKYYDKDSIGGGIPDEDIIRNHIEAYIVKEIKQTHYKEISRLKEDNERLRGEVETVIRWNESWPLRDILNELVQASEILLDKKNYDGHGWEEIRHAMNHAKVIISHLTPSPTTKK